ncbi:hypothetical protein ACN5LI_000718 [Cronobacter turicensis]|jgi:hypothetical protein
MITEKEAIRIARDNAVKLIENGWDDKFCQARVIVMDGGTYWEVSTNVGSPADMDWEGAFFSSPINYYVDANGGAFIGYRTHRDDKICYPKGKHKG